MIRRGRKHIIVDCKYKENAYLTQGKRMKSLSRLFKANPSTQVLPE